MATDHEPIDGLANSAIKLTGAQQLTLEVDLDELWQVLGPVSLGQPPNRIQMQLRLVA